MRKQYKTKLASCAMCKPHKMGWAIRWKPKEVQAMKIAEKDIQLKMNVRPMFGFEHPNWDSE